MRLRQRGKLSANSRASAWASIHFIREKQSRFRCLILVVSASLVQAQRETAWDEQFRAIPDAAAIGRYMQRLSAGRITSVAVCQGQCRLAPGTLQGEGVGRPHRAVRRAVPNAQGTPARNDSAHAVQGHARGAGRGGRPHVEPEGRTAPDLQRVLDRRRRHGAGRLRQLRRPEDYEELDRPAFR
jgi:hypothetical protein